MTAAKLDELLDALGAEWSVGVDRLNEFEQLFGNARDPSAWSRTGSRSSQSAHVSRHIPPCWR